MQKLSNGGMVDQTIFKMAKKYGFNSLYFDEISLGIVDDYVRFVRPFLEPHAVRISARKPKRCAISENDRCFE